MGKGGMGGDAPPLASKNPSPISQGQQTWCIKLECFRPFSSSSSSEYRLAARSRPGRGKPRGTPLAFRAVLSTLQGKYVNCTSRLNYNSCCNCNNERLCSLCKQRRPSPGQVQSDQEETVGGGGVGSSRQTNRINTCISEGATISKRIG